MADGLKRAARGQLVCLRGFAVKPLCPASLSRLSVLRAVGVRIKNTQSRTRAPGQDLRAWRSGFLLSSGSATGEADSSLLLSLCVQVVTFPATFARHKQIAVRLLYA